MRSLLCLPLIESDQVWGVLNLSHPDINAFTEDNERILTIVAGQAAVALANVQLFAELQRMNEALEGTVTQRTGEVRQKAGQLTVINRIAKTVNAAIDFLRANKKRAYQESIDTEDNYTQYPDIRPDGDINRIIEGSERQAIFYKIVENLNPRQKMAFLLCDLQGLPSAEAAEIIDCPQVTLRWYLHEARKKIREKIESDYPEYFLPGKKSKARKKDE